uniref:TBC1 domain family member 4 n=1 Tax=Bombyx mori TaxID=7091 RepID=A0A8R2R2S4_BOMMO|nr:TBC1 domain family member 4 isoform X2 [Bombyx mori]
MKTKLTPVTYLGSTVMDRRFSNAMLPWLIMEIRATNVRDKVSIAIDGGHLKVYNGNFEPVIIHKLSDIIRASQVPGRPEELFYILLDEKKALLNCYMFRAASVYEVTDLFSQMRDPSPGAPSPKGSTGYLASGVVTKNVGFLQQNNSEHLPWTPPLALTGNCNSNLTGESPTTVKSTSHVPVLASLSADLSPSNSHFFEVLYIGKVRISQRKVPETLIDDALHKFALHDAEKALRRRHSLLSSTTTSIDSNDSTDNLSDDKKSQKTNDLSNRFASPSTTPLEPQKSHRWSSVETITEKRKDSTQIEAEFDQFTKERIEIVKKSADLVLNLPKNNLGTVKEDEEKIEVGISKEATRAPEDGDGETKRERNFNFDEIKRKPAFGSEGAKSLPENRPFLRDRSASIGTINSKTPLAQLICEQNRTMLFQVGRSELRLISPDRKQILLHRAFKDVASCVLGQNNKDHFGFVCRETNETYACYVFKCESDSVAGEVVNAIRQAFVAHADLLKKSRDKSPNMTCEHCPMLWYHRLCHDIEGMTEKRTHAFILRRIEQLPEDEQDLIITKYQGGTNLIYETSEHNSFLMMLLRAHCEAKQQRHVHDTAENRSEFLNQYLGGSTIFMKAKRSLSSGFDHLLKRKASRDEGLVAQVKKDTSPAPTPLAQTPTDAPDTPTQEHGKSLSRTTSQDDENPVPKTSLPSEERGDSEGAKGDGDIVTSPMMDIFMKVSDSRAAAADGAPGPDSTWRQAIYEKSITRTDAQDGQASTSSGGSKEKRKRSRQELRRLWEMAIDQTILLVRMEKENKRLKESEESSAVRRMKLEYSELGACEPGAALTWDLLLGGGQRAAAADRHMLAQAVMQGVPRVSRGAIWYFLAEQACLRAPPPDTRHCPFYHTPYTTLLSGLTKHQHAILIDLGRTFPKHSYFASALGPGQLALYNILKAYSLLDPDVGYCQGLSFVAGVLLLHMEEAEAFVLLRHLMFRRGLRLQYLPDMSALQVQLYQLSRLLKDHEPELHAKLEDLDISPALYAAPWMLTLFTSQFPLGLVVRVFDLIFLDSLNIVFAVSLSLLSVHKVGLMLCQSCEEAAEYLKHKLPDIDKPMYEKVMKKSAMEAIENYQKSQARLEAANKSIEQQLTLLSRYVSAHQRADLPQEIKRIVQSHSKRLSFGSKMFSSRTAEEDERRTHKGISTPNLFAKTNKEDVAEKYSPENDRRRFTMKKSLSVHSGLTKNPLKALDERSENERNGNDEGLSCALKELNGKVSGGLAARSDRHPQPSSELPSQGETRSGSYIDDLLLFQSRKCMSLNLSPNIEKSGSKSIDSGFATPLSPDRNSGPVSHPLSDCDVEIKFDGHSTKLKQIRPLRQTDKS